MYAWVFNGTHSIPLQALDLTPGGTRTLNLSLRSTAGQVEGGTFSKALISWRPLAADSVTNSCWRM
jgi:hypothetical protein